ncbi:CBS domain-containing protein [Dyella sp. BiH032]|uniref:CBS domain-containing protein n=1 Tax=Dyella sp. BiH032 TaxID=3075430 RepID=UPI002892BCA7|nr:CBS domain-containing protein [Dyella sp. BiH032]WNL44034.1 CBS domain-containing protein [Dyella sp. BiH032]
MLAKDIGTSRVIQAEASQSLREAARIMHRHQVACLVVVGDSGAPLGVVTERDVMTATLVLGRDPDSATIGSVMARPPVICRDDSTFTELIAIMRGSGLRRLPVVDASGTLVAIVTADDVIAAMAELMESLARALIVDPMFDHEPR